MNLQDEPHKGPLTDLFVALDSSASEAEIVRLLIRWIGDLNFDYFGYQILVSELKDVSFGAGIVAHNFPSEWIDIYAKEQLVRFDPFLAYVAGRSAPIVWRNAAKHLQFNSHQKRFLKLARRHGLHDGISIPIGHAFRGLAVFHFACGHGDVESSFSEIAEMTYVCAATHDKIAEVRRNKLPQNKQLSVRERTAMKLVAEGKTNPEIAEIMSISPHTVSTLLKRSFIKLEAETRATALLRAISTGQIFVKH